MVGRLDHISEMYVAVSEAKAQLTDLVRRAEGGEDIVISRRGEPAVRLVPIKRAPSAEAKRRILDEIMASGAANLTPGPCAARSQDFLYDEDGMPA